MNADYFNRVFPEPFRILGLPLLPLSLGRYRLMRRFSVAFVSNEPAAARAEDLILGLLICSSRTAEFLDWVGSKSFFREVRAWGRKISPCARAGRIPFVGRWWRRHFSFDYLEKVRLFQNYIEEAQRIPAYWQESETGADSAGDWSQAMEVVLRGELGWSLEEIQEEPLSKALADYFKWAENQGLIRLISEAEAKAGEENAKALLKQLKAQGVLVDEGAEQ